MAYNRAKANLGKAFERMIDMTNNKYRNKGIADIRKVPTPVQITSNVRGKITGYTTKGEWVDYVGIYNGRTIVFDAKEVSVDRLPLDNIARHQFDLLKSWHDKGAKAFLLVHFKKRRETFLLPFTLLNEYYIDYLGDGRKSIPYSMFYEQCEMVIAKEGFLVHYLQVI